MKKIIIRNINTEDRFFEIIRSIPNPQMHLYHGEIFSPNDIAITIGEAKNKEGICLYRYIPEFANKVRFEDKFKALKKELNA